MLRVIQEIQVHLQVRLFPLDLVLLVDQEDLLVQQVQEGQVDLDCILDPRTMIIESISFFQLVNFI